MPTLPPITTVNINGHTYNQATFEANPIGTFAAIANDVASLLALISAVGTLTKAITGNVTLTGAECQNLNFVFTGALTGDAAITFAAGFSGRATIVNETTGTHSLVCGLLAGTTVTVPPSGSATAICDGANFALEVGVVRDANGARVPLALDVFGNATFEGTSHTIGNDTVGGNEHIYGTLLVGSTTELVGNVTMDGDAHALGKITAGGNVIANGGVVQTTGFTAAGLSDFVWVTGMRTWVSDALTPVFGNNVVGGGTIPVPVFYNGSAWIVG